MIKLVVFDWNGTLLADVQAVWEGTNKELAVLGHPPISLAKYRQYYDIPLVSFYEALGVDREVFMARGAEAAQAFHAFYEPRVAKAHTRPGTRRTLEALAERGIARVILSNHTMEGIYLQFERLKLSYHFDAVLANDTLDGSLHTGKEGRLSHYLKANRIAPGEVVIVGDTVEEVRIGKNLGLKTVSITAGYNTTERLVAARPDAIIHSMHGLIDVLEDLA